MNTLLGQTENVRPLSLRYELTGLDQLAASPTLALLIAIALIAAAGLALARSHFEPGAFGRRLVQVVLRLIALVAVGVSILGVSRRPVETVEEPSRVVVLVDDSQSMALPAGDAQSAAGSTEVEPGGETRAQEAERMLLGDGLLAKLGKRHQVQVVRLSAPAAVNPTAEAEQAPWAPVSSSTPIGDAIIESTRLLGGPTLAGMVLVSDGGQNAGRDPVEAAASVGAPVYTVGFGPTRLAPRVRILDVVASETAFPNDPFEVTVVVETQGDWAGEAMLKVVALAGPEQAPTECETVGAATLKTSSDASTRSESFQITAKETGVHRYRAILEGANLSSKESAQGARLDFSVNVIDRVVKVLLWSGGPSRDYQFLRNQLFRDKTFQVTVLLDSADSGAAQEAASAIERFPPTSEELDEFDVLAMFDADLSRLSVTQVDMIEEWVSERGGGLLYRPGLVFGPRGLDLPAIAGLRRLLPLEFPVGLLGTQPATSKTPGPVTVTRAGQSEPMLRLAATPEASLEAWRSFPGFFAYYPNVRAKPSATVYATLSPPGGEPIPLLADQLFGAGRTACLTTSESWRLRSRGVERFELLFTNLLRKLASGRAAARQQGLLVFERSSYELGETMTLYARLPASGGESSPTNVPSTVVLVEPDGESSVVTLTPAPDGSRASVARVPAEQLGRYSASAALGAGDAVSATAMVAAPERERGTRTRNSNLLLAIAQAGGGQYYAGFDALGADGRPSLADAIEPRTERTTRFGEPDRGFEWLVAWLLLTVAGGSLILEWFLRRWNRQL